MSFLYPTFLWALAALAIPIIIHLFSFRRFRKVYFTNVKFLKEVKDERATRERIKHLLVLLARLLALAFLVLAFAQPYIPKDEDEIVQGPKAVSIFVDNSFSMNAESNEVSLLEKAKRKATEIVAAYGAEDRFQILSNDFEGRHQRLLNKDEFLEYLEELSSSPNTRTLNEVLERQKQALATSSLEQQSLYLLSDFQKNMAKMDNDTTLKLNFIPLQAVDQRNVFIDSVWFAAPIRMLNKVNNLLVRIKNTGDAPVESARLTLTINNQVKALKDVNLKAGGRIVDTLNFTITQPGWNKSELAITDYPINFDDTYFFSFEVAEKINVLAINQGTTNKYLDALFKTDRSFQIINQSVTQLDYAKLPKNQLIILNQLRDISSGLASELQQYVKSGGSLLIFPSKTMNSSSYNSFLRGLKTNTYAGKISGKRSVDYVNLKQEVFRGVFEKLPPNTDLPYAEESFDMTSYGKTNEQVLIRFRGGKSALSQYRSGAGKVYLAAFSLDTKSNNFPAHAIFVPMLHKIALVGGKNNQLAYTIGRRQTIKLDNKVERKESIFKLKATGDELIPGQNVVGSQLRLKPGNELKEAGLYELYLEENKPLAFFGFNFNRRESILEYFSLPELKEKFKFPNITFFDENAALNIEVGKEERGTELWKWCLIFVLGFLGLEILLLRILK